MTKKAKLVYASRITDVGTLGIYYFGLYLDESAVPAYANGMADKHISEMQFSGGLFVMKLVPIEEEAKKAS